MNLSLSQILFLVIAGISIVTAVGVVLNRNPIRSALLLVVNFVCLAAIYVILNAQVLAMLQLLVYAGAIMVLFVFVIMLLNLGGELARSDPLVGQKYIGLLLGGALLAGLVFSLLYAVQHPIPDTQAAMRASQIQGAGISQIQVLGWDMFTRYVYPFELTSVLLLVGVVGVMILTRRRSAPKGGEDA